MKPLNQILEAVEISVERYELCKIGDTHTQSEIAKDLSSNLFFLAGHKVEAMESWMSFYFQSKGKSEAAKEREADMKCPELYKIRQILSAGSKVLDSIRSTISANK